MSIAHLLVLLGVLVLTAAAIVGLVFLIRWAVRRGDASTSSTIAPAEAERLRREADELRNRAERAERDTDGLV